MEGQVQSIWLTPLSNDFDFLFIFFFLIFKVEIISDLEFGLCFSSHLWYSNLPTHVHTFSVNLLKYPHFISIISIITLVYNFIKILILPTKIKSTVKYLNSFKYLSRTKVQNMYLFLLTLKIQISTFMLVLLWDTESSFKLKNKGERGRDIHEVR